MTRIALLLVTKLRVILTKISALPTRQSYVMTVVRPEERTFAVGVTHLVRMSGWAIAPSIAGWLMQTVAPAIPLLIGATMKIGYDILLYSAFKTIKPPEEK